MTHRNSDPIKPTLPKWASDKDENTAIRAFTVLRDQYDCANDWVVISLSFVGREVLCSFVETGAGCEALRSVLVVGKYYVCVLRLYTEVSRNITPKFLLCRITEGYSIINRTKITQLTQDLRPIVGSTSSEMLLASDELTDFHAFKKIVKDRCGLCVVGEQLQNSEAPKPQPKPRSNSNASSFEQTGNEGMRDALQEVQELSKLGKAMLVDAHSQRSEKEKAEALERKRKEEMEWKQFELLKQKNATSIRKSVEQLELEVDRLAKARKQKEKAALDLIESTRRLILEQQSQSRRESQSVTHVPQEVVRVEPIESLPQVREEIMQLKTCQKMRMQQIPLVASVNEMIIIPPTKPSEALDHCIMKINSPSGELGDRFPGVQINRNPFTGEYTLIGGTSEDRLRAGKAVKATLEPLVIGNLSAQQNQVILWLHQRGNLQEITVRHSVRYTLPVMNPNSADFLLSLQGDQCKMGLVMMELECLTEGFFDIDKVPPLSSNPSSSSFGYVEEL